MVKVTDADIELVEDIVLACEEYRDLWFKPGRREDGRQRYQDAKELAARHRIAGAKAALEKAGKAMRSVEPDTEAAGCEATWGDFQQVAEDAIRNIDPEECE